MRPNIDDHDYDTKMKKVYDFIERRRQGEDHPALPRPRAGPWRARHAAAPARPGRRRRDRQGRAASAHGRPPDADGARAEIGRLAARIGRDLRPKSAPREPRLRRADACRPLSRRTESAAFRSGSAKSTRFQFETDLLRDCHKARKPAGNCGFPLAARLPFTLALGPNNQEFGRGVHVEDLLAAVGRPRRARHAARLRAGRDQPDRPDAHRGSGRGRRRRRRRRPTRRRRTRATSSSPPRAAARSSRTCRSPSPRSAASRCRIAAPPTSAQLNQLAPSLLVSSTGTEANGSARIRGIGTVGDNPGLESSVAVFVDGVYRSRTRHRPQRARRDRADRGAARSAGHPVRPQRLGRPHPRHQQEAEHERVRRLSAELTYGNYDYIRGRRRRHRPDRRARSASGSTASMRAATASTTSSTRPAAPRARSTTATASSSAASCCSSRATTLSIRLIGDYTTPRGILLRRRLSRPRDNPLDRQPQRAGDSAAGRRAPATPDGNNIINVLRDLGRRSPRSTIPSAATST